MPAFLLSQRTIKETGHAQKQRDVMPDFSKNQEDMAHQL